MAQQVERVLGKDEVTGSNPVSSSKSKIRAHLAPFLRCACLPGQALRIYAAKSRFRLLPA